MPEVVAEPHLLLAALNDPAAVLVVSTGSAPRAVRIVHALLSALEHEGCEVGWAREPKRGLEFRLHGQAVSLALREEYKERDVLPPGPDLNATPIFMCAD